MRVYQVQGEPTRFHVESTSLECPGCKKLFPRTDLKNRSLRVGGQCPACGTGTLDIRFHLVDLACWRPVGQCSCEHFQFRLKQKVELVSPATLKAMSHNEAEALRCSHIRAARDYALDLTVDQHERERNPSGRVEEAIA